MTITPREPAPQAAAVRRFRDPAYRPIAPTLAELRQTIDALDEQIVQLLAERALCVRDATRFKADEFQVRAPARQAEVFARMRSLAAAHEHKFPGFPDIVEAGYHALVGGFVAAEGQLFAQTELIDS